MSDDKHKLHDVVEMTAPEILASTFLAEQLSAGFAQMLGSLSEPAVRRNVVASSALALFMAECLHMDGERGVDKALLKERFAALAEGAAGVFPRVVQAHKMADAMRGGGGHA